MIPLHRLEQTIPDLTWCKSALERVYQAPLAWQGLREGGVKLLTIDPTHKDARVNTLDI